MFAIWDHEGRFVCIRNTAKIAEMTGREYRGIVEELQEIPDSIPPQYRSIKIPGIATVRAGGADWVADKSNPVVIVEDEPSKESDENTSIDHSAAIVLPDEQRVSKGVRTIQDRVREAIPTDTGDELHVT